MHRARAPALSVACSTDPARARAQLLVETILVGNGFGAPLPKVAPADKPWHTAKIALISAVLWVPTGIVMMARPAPAASAPGAATGVHVRRPAAGVPRVAEGAPGQAAGSWAAAGMHARACAQGALGCPTPGASLCGAPLSRARRACAARAGGSRAARRAR